MGEHQSGGVPGRRRVHPGDSAYGHRAARDADGRWPGHRGTAGCGSPGLGTRHVLDEAELEALLVAALIRDRIDAEAEQRAVAAFLAARDAGAHRARTRRRDDWRPRERRHPGRSLKATLSVLLASLTLGGVAVAAIGSVGSTDGADDRGRPPASTRAPGASAGEPTGTPSGVATGSASARPDRPAPSRDTEAHCRAYEEVDGRGKAMDATAWKRLVEAAGGERKVTAYCAEQLARAEAKPGSTARPEKSADAPGSAGADNGASNADKGAGNSGSGAGSADSGAGNADPGSGAAQSGGDAADGASSGTSGASGAKGRTVQPDDRRP
ncbi:MULTISPECIES: hypothetical protein [Streptomyces]|uniref:Uncharacterized protein n=1 Tax=Streptomyces chartreusis NRRL 3882 TaxID=1079985 RepID=A0A2N9B894_STRCX|nr:MULTISPECIES: hypothetical protein [Streptomyces]MYS92454.1 hypothetical protein [Streptomyces sp. SID5464]SOR79549.1 hypothetical protein SCNRRL3882_3011 [Streptomyces chartreusis NRRL 3882]